MRVRFIVLMAAVFIAMYVGYQQITAQNLVTCPDLVQHAIESVGNNCGGLDRNSACYGFSDVIATFSQAQPVNFFTRPSDRARLLELQDLSTSPMSDALDRWGIALLSVQANLPDTLPGQSVIFMLMGDTQIENAVPPEETFQTGATLNVTLQIGADLYYEASFDSQLVGNIPQGTALTADAVSEDGQWVRVVYRGMPGWITRQVLTTDGDLASLPVIGPDTKTPMQAFYFRTSISGTECTEAPNALVVQGPQNLTVDINANGADIQLGSTIVLYLLPVDPQTLQYLIEQYGELGAVSRLMQLVVLDGHVVLNEGTPDEIVLETGETTFICLDAPENLGADGQPNDQEVLSGCPWAPPRPVTLEDIERFRELEGITLNYEIDLPLTLPTVTPTFTNTPRPYVYVPPTATPLPSGTPMPTETPQQQQQPQPPAPTATPNCGTIPNPVSDVPTLIAAVVSANCNPDASTINLSGESTFSFPSTYPGGDNLTVLPAITTPVTINGAGSTFTSGGEFSHRYLTVNAGGSLTVGSLLIQYGNVGTADGGAIYNSGSLSLNNVYITNMTALNGGGIYNGGTLSLNFTNIDGSYATNGGGIYNAGTATISNSWIGSNSDSYNSATLGGGMYNNGTATINKTTFAYNNSDSGGGIYSAGGSMSFLNSTVSSNSASTNGGGIYMTGGSATLNFTTVYSNSSAGAAVAAVGGSVTAKNSIIAGTGTDCAGSVSSVSGNFSDDDQAPSCSGFTAYPDLMLSGLNTLAFNSPAVDDGGVDCTTNGGTTVTDDQAGTSRPQDNTGSGMGGCDAGSFELPSQF